MHESEEMREAIEERLLNFNFRKDTFHVPQDPLGRDGPNLDNFLQFCSTKQDPNWTSF